MFTVQPHNSAALSVDLSRFDRQACLVVLKVFRGNAALKDESNENLFFLDVYEQKFVQRIRMKVSDFPEWVMIEWTMCSHSDLVYQHSIRSN